MIVDLRTFDVGYPAETLADYAAKFVELTHQSWESGADLVIFPEYSWMGLERFVAGASPLLAIADLFWERLWPELQAKLTRRGKAVVLGTVPFRAADGTLRNRAPILVEGTPRHQDKLFLTPWEKHFQGGDALHLWTFQGVKFGVLVCFDSEVPELSVRLRGQGVQCLLIPSATENVLGTERVGRCASARAVELGCYVGVCHLVGQTQSELVDENVGRLAWFTPSQSPFRETVRETVSEVLTQGFHRQRCELDAAKLAAAKANAQETNPALLHLSDSERPAVRNN